MINETELVYPPSPTDVPADLATPTPAYRRRAWFAIVVLAGFVFAYIGLASIFAWTAYYLIVVIVVGEGGATSAILAGIASAFLSAFMFKALIFIKHGSPSGNTEITAAEHPRLFLFLGRLAAEVGAPQLRRVYLSNRVNAAVFYDLSVINFLLPSRKSLEIGLALVNVLNVSEFKAVLAHEYGHFAQRSMAIGQWVYIGQQIAAHIVAKRDAFDAFLGGISRLDFRIAWIGWALRLTVWAIRSFTDGMFRLVLLAQRALSREMELQADLVSVRAAGSDALVHALHKLPAADNAWARACGFAKGQLATGHAVRDLFAIQSATIDRLRRVLAMPDFGRPPPLPESDRQSHRVFRQELAAPPSMWMSHPLSSEREANCKRRYVAADTNESSAWTLFTDPERLRESQSALFVASPNVPVLSDEAALANLDRQYDRPHMDRVYRGAFVGRLITRSADDIDACCGTALLGEQLSAQLAALYPGSLEAELALLGTLTTERQSLQGLVDGTLKPPDSVFRHRGRELTRRQLEHALHGVIAELAAVTDRVSAHDRTCRAVHMTAARELGGGWDRYLKELLGLLHYAEHSEANIADAHAAFAFVWSRVAINGVIRRNDVDLLLGAAREVHAAVAEAYNQRSDVELPLPLLARLGVTAWPLRHLTFNVMPPTRATLAEWLKVQGHCVEQFGGLFSALRYAVLDELLDSEARVVGALRAGHSLGEAPPPPLRPAAYRRMCPGMERPRRLEREWWDQFLTASGAGPMVGRFVLAAGLIGMVFVVAYDVGRHGDPNTQFQRAYALQHAASNATTANEAANWYRKAAGQGLAAAQNNLGLLYLKGEGVPKDSVQAAFWLKKAADQGLPSAQVLLGSLLADGTGIPRDDAQAFAWFQRAAGRGLAAAQFDLGLMYQSGRGVSADNTQAFNNFTLAAGQGFAPAQVALGMLYETGRGTAQNLPVAVDLYRKAANQGDASGEFRLFAAYYQGTGMQKDIDAARHWLKLAADQHYAPALNAQQALKWQ